MTPLFFARRALVRSAYSRSGAVAFAVLAAAGCSIHSVPADGYTSQPVKVGDRDCFQITRNLNDHDQALGLYCAEPAIPSSPHACDPPLCELVPDPSTSPLPRVTPTRASRSRTPSSVPQAGYLRSSARTSGGAREGVGVTGSLTLDVTGYCWTGSRTASGAWPRLGMAAGNRWPFGTRLRVPGIGVVTITDRIGAHSDLDIYLGHDGCEQRARRFGRQHLTVEVLP